MEDPQRLGVLASGRGSNAKALIAAHERGDLSHPVAVVVSNNSGAGALQHARAHGVPTAHVSGKTDADPGAALLCVLRAHGVGILVLAGYMKQVDPRVVLAYEGHSVNIHPGPLPRFGGRGMHGERVHQAVLDSGVSVTGPTVHRVADRYDEGEILAHREVPVLPHDTAQTLSVRVLAVEHDLYWRTIEALNTTH